MEASEPVWDVSKAKRGQRWVNRFCRFVIMLPYLRRVHGREKIDPRRRHIIVCNHVSLLDALMFGGLMTSCRFFPLLILADKKVWEASWIRRALSRPIAFMLERGKLNRSRIKELQVYARAIENFTLLVFPEGTRGNGVDVAECQPGIHFIAQTARAPIVPVFIENMQRVSTKTGPFHFFGGLRKVEFHFGDVIEPEEYLSMERREFTEFIRRKISETRPAGLPRG